MNLPNGIDSDAFSPDCSSLCFSFRMLLESAFADAVDRTKSAGASPVIGKPAIAGIEKAHHSGHMSRGIQGPRPPDLAAEVDNRACSSVDFPFGRGYAHFAKQLFARKIQKGLDARVLQGREAEAARFECATKATRECGAGAAVAVKANPAAGGAASSRVSYF